LAATLNQLPSVLDVDIEIDRSLQKISSNSLLSPSVSSNSAYALVGDRIYQQSDFGSEPVTEFDQYLKSYPATDFGVSEDQRQIALIGAGGLAVAYPGTRAAALRIVDNRQSLTTPVIDGYKLTWSMSHDAGHGIRVFSGQRSVASFTPNWMRRLDNKQFALSPDESRLLVSGHNKDTSYLYAVAISRNVLGIPTLAPKAKLLVSRVAEGIMANWVSDTDIVYSAFARSGTTSPVVQTIGGSSVELPSFTASVSLAASAGGQSVYLVTSNGELYTNRNQGWVFLRKGVSAIHFAH
jgi:hypothetical protein